MDRQRANDSHPQKERRIAELAYERRETPSKMIFDSLGRPFLGIEDLGGGTSYETKGGRDLRRAASARRRLRAVGGGERDLTITRDLRVITRQHVNKDWTMLVNQTTIAAMATAAVSSLEATVFTSSSTRDALRPLLAAISPDGSEVAHGSSERAALKTGLARPLEDIEQFVRPGTSENASHASGHE